MGVLPTAEYQSEECTLDSPARLFLFSDGAYEIHRPDDSMLEFSEFESVVAGPVTGDQSELDAILRFAQETRGDTLLEDDFSIIKMTV